MILLRRRHKTTSTIGASLIPRENLPKGILTPDHVRDVLLHFTGTYSMHTNPNKGGGGLWIKLTNEDPKLRNAFSQAEVYILNRLQGDMVFSFIDETRVDRKSVV